MNRCIYKDNITGILSDLADLDYQRNIWTNLDNPNNLCSSFVEAANMLFDDCVVGDYLEEGEILFDKAVTQALRELGAAVDAVDEYRTEEEIIADPLMEIVRQKAAEALRLIEASDERESTVEIRYSFQDI